MNQCPYPVIPSYLGQEVIERGALGASVTHIWTEDVFQSKEIAACSGIPNICHNLDELINSVDGVLHARDDYEMHPKFIETYVNAKKPCFIDKPFCLDIDTARKLFILDPLERYLFTCSALIFSSKLHSAMIQNGRKVKATGPKDWEKYAIHLIEPSLKILNDPSLIDYFIHPIDGASKHVTFNFDNDKTLEITTSGALDTPFSFIVDNTAYLVDDYYFMFRQSLEMFIKFINTGLNPISRAHTLQVISLLEKGNK
jgi:hypothetical protein